jgi:hypothetical protein
MTDISTSRVHSHGPFPIPDWDIALPVLLRAVSGTYRSNEPAHSGQILELRVDVDGRRPQQRMSGDFFTKFSIFGFSFTLYTGSFVAESVEVSLDSSEAVIGGPVVYYSDPANTGDEIEVHMPRANIFSPAPAACVTIRSGSTVNRAFMCPKTSEYFRTATLEIDRFQGTVFPPGLDPDIDPSPPGLPATVSTREVFLRSGIDLQIIQDDLLTDPDGPDIEENWSEAELHDLMEARFDGFADMLQWNLYGVVVPRFGDPTYNSGYYGTMFDWGGWQTGDTYFRQGAAIAEDAIRGREVGTLYETSDKKDRLILHTFIHEIGHAFNLPHSWQRGISPDSGSNSFMNYPWGYTGGGGESGFWSDFRWEFDDVELIWMRHADRNDVIFGGRDWIGNNLSVFLEPQLARGHAPLRLTVQSPGVLDYGAPVELQLRLENTGEMPLEIADRMQPEDGLVRVLIRRPSGEIVEYVPPVRRLLGPPEMTILQPGAWRGETIRLSFGAKGHQFMECGQYQIRALYYCPPHGVVVSASHRLRIATPKSRESEQLAHLLASEAAAKFLYFGGSGRHPELVSELEEAAERHADTDPYSVRYIKAALGRHAGRAYKHVKEKGGRRVVVASKPDFSRAVQHLEAASAPLPDRYGRECAFNTVAEARLREQIARYYLKMGRHSEAERVARTTEESVHPSGKPAHQNARKPVAAK